jgi:hypothetical protein
MTDPKKKRLRKNAKKARRRALQDALEKEGRRGRDKRSKKKR